MSGELCFTSTKRNGRPFFLYPCFLLWEKVQRRKIGFSSRENKLNTIKKKKKRLNQLPFLLRVRKKAQTITINYLPSGTAWLHRLIRYFEKQGCYQLWSRTRPNVKDGLTLLTQHINSPSFHSHRSVLLDAGWRASVAAYIGLRQKAKENPCRSPPKDAGSPPVITAVAERKVWRAHGGASLQPSLQALHLS